MAATHRPGRPVLLPAEHAPRSPPADLQADGHFAFCVCGAHAFQPRTARLCWGHRIGLGFIKKVNLVVFTFLTGRAELPTTCQTHLFQQVIHLLLKQLVCSVFAFKASYSSAGMVTIAACFIIFPYPQCTIFQRIKILTILRKWRWNKCGKLERFRRCSTRLLGVRRGVGRWTVLRLTIETVAA